jgi:hypothetical protein
MAIDSTIINGSTYAWSSVRLELDGFPYAGVLEITYSDKVEVSYGYGLTPGHAPLRRTRGKYSVDDPKVSMAGPSGRTFLAALGARAAGNGFGEVTFPITVSYSEPTLGTVVDTLEDCRVIGNSVSNSESTDENKVEFTVSCMRIRWNGQLMYRSF